MKYVGIRQQERQQGKIGRLLRGEKDQCRGVLSRLLWLPCCTGLVCFDVVETLYSLKELVPVIYFIQFLCGQEPLVLRCRKMAVKFCGPRGITGRFSTR